MTADKAISQALLEAELGEGEEESVKLFKQSLRNKGFLVLPLSTEGLEVDINER